MTEQIYFTNISLVMKKILFLILKILPQNIAHAHCDIPCGIYDPHRAQLAAHTVIRMTNLIIEEKENNTDQKNLVHKIARLTAVKEEHAEIVKEEVRIIWGDYFKEEHLKEYPKLHDLVFEIIKLSSKTKQGIDIDSAKQLLENVQEFSEIFYKTKGVEPTRIKSLYPTEGDIIFYK